MTGSRRRWLGSLRARLLVADVVLVAVAFAALLITTYAVSAQRFTSHLRRAGETDPYVIAHAREAFWDSLVLGLGAALVAAAVTGGVVALVTSRRLSAPFAVLARAADQVAAGRFHVRVPDPGIGAEGDDLARAFRSMASRLAEADLVRRRQQSDLAHELRSPIATLSAQIEAIEDGVLQSDPATLTSMRMQLERVQRLIDDLATLAAAEERALRLDLRDVDLGDEVGRLVSVFAARVARAGVTLAAQPQTVWVMADPHRVAQILGNLVDNALRHTHPGGRIDVVVETVADVAMVSVIDDGDGLDDTETPYVFDRLYRGDRSRRRVDGDGSGLGLTISRALARAHSGDVDLSSEGLGHGTTARLRLPRSHPTSTRSAASTGSPQRRVRLRAGAG